VKVLWQEGLWAAPLEAWEGLLRDDPMSSPFLSPAWVGAWLRHFGDPARLVLLSAWDDGALVGLAPLVRKQRGPARVLAGAAQRDGDHWDVIAEPALRTEVETALAGHLMRHRRRWDLLDLAHVSRPAALSAAAQAAGLRVGLRLSVACPRLPLPDTFEAYLAGLSQSRRGNLRRRLRQLDGGAVELRTVTADGIGEALRRWQAIRRRELTAKGVRINPVHATDAFRRFLRGAIDQLAPQGGAEVLEFVSGGKVVGSYINLLDDRGHYLYLGGYEPEARSFGLGKVVVGRAIQTGIEAGRRYVDFGRGGEDYKYWFGADGGRVESLVIGHGGPRSSLALTSRTTWSAARERARRARTRRVG
jgi:CelD/BcsL family acetyltransferase involved in cellulose biosynthesis